MRLTVLCDLDAIVIDLIRPWVAWYNQTHEDTITIDDITTYAVENHMKKTKNVYKFFEEHINYTNCPVLPGASDGLRYLHDAKHDVIICTATAGQTAHLKWELIHKAAPWIKEGDVMVGSRKEKMFGDVFIDDAPKNVVKYRNAWPQSHILTIAYPYNRDIKTLVNCYADDHHNTELAWKEMTKYVQTLAEG